jgi:hypothetical protein
MFFEDYKSRSILIDTNLMVLVVVGNYRRDRILTFKRTIQYTLEDHALMLQIIAGYDRRITTPHILTEVDNLTRQLPQAEHAEVARSMAQVLSALFEVHVPSEAATRSSAFAALGLTDCVTMLSSLDTLVITDDFRLSNTLASMGREVVNINHIRTLGWE